MRRTPAVSSSTSQFGQNQWLVDEMYQKFKNDPSSVDESWHEFLADYTPDASGESQAGQPTPAQAPAPAPAQAATTAPVTSRPVMSECRCRPRGRTRPP
ncbi:2-oxoglutarate dehydrogenase E1 subunit family protein, partial [Nocardia cyriacigeorgica]|uniref:2-oxoglutarate dehydrogenase E1 subunit family protein n=1 Tax=Nocardia cyriacigeorgica TaxID=135487 RepID=UPI002456515D